MPKYIISSIENIKYNLRGIIPTLFTKLLQTEGIEIYSWLRHPARKASGGPKRGGGARSKINVKFMSLGSTVLLVC